MKTTDVSPLAYLVIGAFIGVTGGLVLLPLLEERLPEDSLGRRLLRKVPMRYKAAAGLGAARGAGEQAAEDVEEGFR